MAKKINQEILDKVKLLCYDVVLGEQIDKNTLTNVKNIARQYLESTDYKVIDVKCDWENNPPDVVDRNEVIIDIKEEEFPGSSAFYKHRIIL